MPRPIVVDVQPAFGGGLNLTADPSQLQPDQVRAAVNVRLTEFGGAGKRLGTRRMMPTALTGAPRIDAGYTWYQTTDTELLVVAGGTLYAAPYYAPTTALPLGTEDGDALVTEAWDTLVSEAMFSNFVAQEGTLAEGPVSCATFLYTDETDTECVYLADGGALNRWDGTALETDLTDTPDVSVIHVYNQRLFGVSGTDQTIWWSGLNNGDTLGVGANGGGSAIIRTFGDQKITGLAVSGASLLIFHASGISKFTGFTQDDIAIAAGAQGITGEVGTTAPFSVVEVAGNVYFLGPNGFYVVNEASAPVSISTPIDSLLRRWDDATLAGVRGVHARRFQEVRWWVPGYGVLVYNYRLKAWAGPWTGGYLSPATSCLFESQDTDGKFVVMRGDVTGWVSICDYAGTYTDNAAVDGAVGEAFRMTLQPHRFFASDYMAEKAYRWAYLLMDPRGTDDVTVTWETQTGADEYFLEADQLTETTTISIPDHLRLETGTRMRWENGWLVDLDTNDDTYRIGRSMFRIPMSDRGEWVDITITDDGEADALYSRVEVQAFNLGRRGGT